MIIKTNRILMNEVDASPGNGAPAAPAAPSEPVAEQKAPAFDLDALVSRLSKVIDEKVEAKQNAAFAKLRKEGALKQDKPEPSASPATPTPSAPAVVQAGMSMADVEALIERKSLIAARAAKHGLNEAQVRRFEAALTGVSRESLASEAEAFLTDMGLVRSTESTTVTPAPLPSAAPISDKGSPAPGGVANYERELLERPLDMSPAAKAAMDAKYGVEKARKMRLEAAQPHLSRIKVTPK
jgi:hypothetical protein